MSQILIHKMIQLLFYLVAVVIPLGKDDVKYVRSSSNGMDCGVHVADIGSEQSHAT